MRDDCADSSEPSLFASLISTNVSCVGPCKFIWSPIKINALLCLSAYSYFLPDDVDMISVMSIFKRYLQLCAVEIYEGAYYHRIVVAKYALYYMSTSFHLAVNTSD